ncbi:antibiotic biosynthesis monooxygenase [Curtobacterium flaccumfaciens]|uniref:antibiotic biosynthesis monooxygenase n=1 Tax=Curtobacterium flaccumfaciens TaxID=2035 RepID=UPI003B987952
MTSRAVFRTSGERVTDFLRIAFALQDAAIEGPGTVRYEWFSGLVPHEFVVLEEYVDPAAATNHNQDCADLLQELSGVAELLSVEFHGELDESLTRWIDSEPSARSYPPLERPGA